MAFAFALPAIGTAVLPAIGTVASGLGGALASGAGALGSAVGAIPGLSSIGGAIGSLGSGLGGGLGALGAGNIGGALSSLGSGVLGAGSNVLGGLGSLYGGADKLLGGLLPNIGGVGITPQNGYLGALFQPQAAGSAMQGPQIPLSNQFQGFLDGGPAVSQANINAGLNQMGITQDTGGGLFGGGLFSGDTIGKVADVAKTLQGLGLGGADSGMPGVTQQSVNTRAVTPGQTMPPQKPIILGGGQTPMNQPLQLGPPTSFFVPENITNANMSAPARYDNRLEELEGLMQKITGDPAGVTGGMTPQQKSLASMYGASTSMNA